MIVIRTDQRGKLNYNSQLNKNNWGIYVLHVYKFTLYSTEKIAKISNFVQFQTRLFYLKKKKRKIVLLLMPVNNNDVL